MFIDIQPFLLQLFWSVCNCLCWLVWKTSNAWKKELKFHWNPQWSNGAKDQWGKWHPSKMLHYLWVTYWACTLVFLAYSHSPWNVVHKGILQLFVSTLSGQVVLGAQGYVEEIWGLEKTCNSIHVFVHVEGFLVDAWRQTYYVYNVLNHMYNIIQSHDIVLRDGQYYVEYSSHTVWMWGLFLIILSIP